MSLEATRFPLMAKYLDSMCFEISELTVTGNVDLWRLTVPEMAAKCQYLHHGILSVASLPDRTMALEHHNIGLSLFLEALADAKIEPLFAQQCMMTSFSYGFLEKDLAGFKNIVTIIRGTSTIIGQKGKPQGPMLELTVPNPVGPSKEMQVLTDRLHGSISGMVYHEMYTFVIGMVGIALGNAEDPRFRQFIMNNIWFELHPEFLNLVWMGEPLALACMAGFGVAMHRSCKDSLLVAGWGKAIVHEIRTMLGPDWDEWLDWTMEAVAG